MSETVVPFPLFLLFGFPSQTPGRIQKTNPLRGGMPAVMVSDPGSLAVPDGASVQGPPVCRTGRRGGGWGQTQTLKAAEFSFEQVRAVTTSWAEGSVVLHQGEKVEITREFPHGGQCGSVPQVPCLVYAVNPKSPKP